MKLQVDESARGVLSLLADDCTRIHFPQLLPEVAIDYLNVDCEGLGHDVLLINNWSKYRPQLVSVKIHGLTPEPAAAHPAVQLLKQQGDAMHSHSFVTAFFERVGS